MLLLYRVTRRASCLICCSLFFLALAVLAERTTAQASFDVHAHYIKREVTIPMRDGVKLYTVLFIPKDTSHSYPILMERTPYSVPYGADNFPRVLGPSARFAESGFIFAYQDVRGKFMSEGDYVNMRPELPETHGPKEIDESTDTYDTIDWLIQNVAGNNGRVGMWGISYPGFYAAAGAIHAHPALKAVSPQAPIADWFLGDDVHHNGAFYLMDNFAWDFDSSFDYPRTKLTKVWDPVDTKYDTDNGYKFYMNLGPLKNANTRYFRDRVPFWNELMAHGTYDAYWKERNLLPHLKEMHPAMLIVGGWFDAEDFYGPLHIFHTVEQKSPKTPTYLSIGPWPHGGWARGPGNFYGDIPFHSNTGDTYRDTIEFPFFNHYLKGVGTVPSAKAQVFVTGSNMWRSFDAWPPHNLKAGTLYFQPDHALTFTKPIENVKTASDSFVSDPANPVPYAPFPDVQRRSEYMIADQRFAAKRPDVLTYSTAPLRDDVTIVGPITANLFVSTSGTDSDWIVKVIDVYPQNAPASESASGKVAMGGYQRLVRADVMRGKFRDSFETPTPFEPNAVTKVRYALPDICHTFRKGHRIMVQVQSSWFPLVDRNPQQFCDIATADAADFHAVTNRLYRSVPYPSSLSFGTLTAP